jgi:hypothetical protein
MSLPHDGTNFGIGTLVVVRDLDIRSVPVDPSKADAPLTIDPDAHLSHPIAFQWFELVPRRMTQIIESCRGIKLAQFTKGSILDVPWKLAASLTLPDSLGLLASERPDHPPLYP